MKRAARIGAVVIGALAFALALRHADLGVVLALIRGSGPAIALVMLPFLGSMSVDTLGWRMLLARLDRRVAYPDLLRVRLSAEALQQAMPVGAVVAETAKSYLLLGRGVPVPDTIAAVALKKTLLVSAHAVFVLVAALFAWLALGWRGLAWALASGAAFLAATAFALGRAFTRARVSGRAHDALARIPSKRLRAWLASRRRPFERADERMVTLGSQSLMTAALPFLASWACEGFETWLILRVLGAHVSLPAAIVVEASSTFLRNLAFFVPAGLGVQDLGYVALIGRVTRGATFGPAFVLVKRAKELVWIGIGISLWLADPAHRPAAAGA